MTDKNLCFFDGFDAVAGLSGSQRSSLQFMTSTHPSNEVFSTLELVHSLPPQQMGPGHTACLHHFQSPPMRVNSEKIKGD